MRTAFLNKYISRLHILPVDQVTIDNHEDSIGIEDVRNLLRTLFLAPQRSPYTLGIIRNAQQLTTAAQHALLKTLEEPPRDARIILELPTHEALMPTIVSRCTCIAMKKDTQIPQEKSQKIVQEILTLMRETPGKQLTYIDTFASSKEIAIEWTLSALVALEHLLKDTLHTKNVSKTTILVSYSHLLLSSLGKLTVNVTPKLVIDTIFLPDIEAL
ncbi:hypothetical protein HY409_00775 [Candidatus Gottesmanbacteria bacterium]|nr:hypothetical protein [Candidatus Gottesmanbacteria bacterium]